MKRILLIQFWLLLLPAYRLPAQHWYANTLPFGVARDVNSIAIPGPGVIFGAGGHEYNDSIQSIWRTESFGLSWDQNPIGNIPTNLSSWITSIAFTDSLNGFGVGDNGKMVSTNNGGNSWSFASTPIIRNFNKVVYASPTVLYAVGGVFGDSIHGYPGTQTIVKSRDGGNTWTTIRDTSGYWLHSVFFIDSLKGYAVGDSATIVQTLNGGLSWAPVACPLQRTLRGIAFSNADTGYIVGGTADNLTRTILQTTNGGNTWTTLRDESGPRLSDISFSGPATGYAVGDSTTLLTTADYGYTWVSQVVDNSNTTADFTSVRFLNPGLGAIGCKGGLIYIYSKDTLAQANATGAIVTDTTAVLLGTVNTHGFAGNYSFVHSTDPGFSSYFQTSVQNITSDTLSQVSAPIAYLSPNTTYYFYVAATTTAGTVNSNVVSFTTPAINTQINTNYASNVTTTSATLNGNISKFHTNANLVFQYGTTTALGSQVTASPSSVHDSLSHTVTANITGLEPSTAYYCRLAAVTNSNISYDGNIDTFFTGTVYSSFSAMAANNITTTSAQLNGIASGFLFAANISFEYDTSLAFSHSLTGNPPSIVDSSQHYESVSIGGLRPATLYYFRLKATTSEGIFYSNGVSFYTTSPDTNFETLGATQISTTGAQLNGLVSGLQTTTNLYFEYGATVAMGTQVAATPATVNDAAQHMLTAQLSALQPNTTYYFRLKGTSQGHTYYGNVYTFYTNSNFPVISTLAPTLVSNNSAQLNGSAAGFSVPVNLFFQYGTTPSMLSQSASYNLLTDTGLFMFNFTLNALAPNQNYYYRLVGQSSLGTFLGSTVEFSTGQASTYIETTSASNVTSNSAQLNGSADHLYYPTAFSFEYGTTQALGTTVIAVPDTISDTLQHYVSASVTGLQNNTLYYYRVVGTDVSNTVFYGSLRQVFVTDCEIPNCDFQNWQNDTVLLPQGWNILGANFKRVPGHSGNYAMQVGGVTLALLGVIGNSGAVGGQSFHYRPDSAYFWSNHNIAAGDTGMMLVYLTNGANIIGQAMGYVTGNSAGAFQRIAVPVVYNSPDTPDSAVIGFSATNINNSTPANNPNEFNAIDDVSFSGAAPAVYNGGFETWFSYPHLSLNNWAYLKYVLVDSANEQQSTMVEQSFFATPGDYAAEVRNVALTGPFNGFFMNADMNTNADISPLIKHGPTFPVYARHTELDGYYKFLPVNGDSMTIEVFMFNHGQQISSAYMRQSNEVNEFTPFTIPIPYTNNPPDPDSAQIEIRTLSAKGASAIFIDKLHFDGFAPVGVSVIELNPGGDMIVYPNPAYGYLTIETIQLATQPAYIQLMDLSGKAVRSMELAAGQNKGQMETNDVAAGIYVLRLATGGQVFNKKVIILK